MKIGLELWINKLDIHIHIGTAAVIRDHLGPIKIRLLGKILSEENDKGTREPTTED